MIVSASASGMIEEETDGLRASQAEKNDVSDREKGDRVQRRVRNVNDDALEKDKPNAQLIIGPLPKHKNHTPHHHNAQGGHAQHSLVSRWS